MQPKPRDTRSSNARPARLYTMKELCERLGVSRFTIMREMDAGRLRYTRIRKYRLVSDVALSDYIERNSVSSRGAA